jgi:hypothetical protein
MLMGAEKSDIYIFVHTKTGRTREILRRRGRLERTHRTPHPPHGEMFVSVRGMDIHRVNYTSSKRRVVFVVKGAPLSLREDKVGGIRIPKSRIITHPLTHLPT